MRGRYAGGRSGWWLGVAVLGIAVAASAQEGGSSTNDPAREAIEQALQAHERGDDHAAIDLLQKAIAALQRTLSGQIERFLPEPPEGWTAEPIQRENVAFGVEGAPSGHVIQFWRRYRRADGTAQVKLTLTNSPLLVNPRRAMEAMVRNPGYRQILAQQGTQISLIDEAPWTGWKQSLSGGSAEISAFAGNFLVHIEAESGGLPAAEAIWKAIDRKGLGRYATSSSRK